MTAPSILLRLTQRAQRELSSRLSRRPLSFTLQSPFISFTFDDFPQSSVDIAGPLLAEYGIHATYYTSFGLMNKDTPVGPGFSERHLRRVVEAGHELGCHTFHHSHAWKTGAKDFEASIIQNRQALARVAPQQAFETLSYPISHPRPANKSVAAMHFAACRGGGQDCNIGLLDRNHLQSFFLEKSRDDFAAIHAVLARNRETRGWLIWSTHDVSPEPTRFGCTPQFFRRVIEASLASGAAILPVGRALKEVTAAATV